MWAQLVIELFQEKNAKKNHPCCIELCAHLMTHEAFLTVKVWGGMESYLFFRKHITSKGLFLECCAFEQFPSKFLWSFMFGVIAKGVPSL